MYLKHDIPMIVDGLDDGHLLTHDAEEVNAARREECTTQCTLLRATLR